MTHSQMSTARLLAGGLLLTGCSPDPSEESPLAQESPTPALYPAWERTTWGGHLIEYWDEHVEANTSLYFNIEEQEEDVFAARIYHFFGYIIIDGLEIPPNNAIDMKGQFLGNDQLRIWGNYYGHSLDVLVDYLDPNMIWFAYLNLDDGYYDVDVLMGDGHYVEFAD